MEIKKNNFDETAKTVIVSLLIALFAIASIAETRFIQSESMLPTLKIDSIKY